MLHRNNVFHIGLDIKLDEMHIWHRIKDVKRCGLFQMFIWLFQLTFEVLIGKYIVITEKPFAFIFNF